MRVSCEGYDDLDVTEGAAQGGRYSSAIRSSLPRQEVLTNPLARDLLRLGQAAFIADRAFRRGQRLGRRTRVLTVDLPVEEPARWRRLADHAASLARFVTQDYWFFRFSALDAKGRSRISRSRSYPSANPGSVVSLFSDGLDSLCGVAAALEREEVPILVSHSPPGFATVNQRLAALLRGLGKPDATFVVVNVAFKLSDRDAEDRRRLFPERTRRSRPMLYLCMAGAVALEFGIPRVCLNENGVLSVNLPFRADLSGSRISRHGHPETLRRFAALLSELQPGFRPIVENPLYHLTKAEELQLLGSALPVARETISCEYGRQQIASLIHWLRQNGRPVTGIKECGLCFPCLVRRIAMSRAGMNEPGHYVFDARKALAGEEPNADAWLFRLLASNVNDLRQFCMKILQMQPAEFTSSFFSELSLLPGPRESVADVAATTYRLYQRFAGEFISYLRG